MAAWIAFWTALWVGSSRISRWLIDLLFSVSQPTESTPETDHVKDEAAAAEPKSAAVAGGATALRLGCLTLAGLFINGTPYTKRIVLTLAIVWVVTALVLGFAAAMAAKPDQDSQVEPKEPAPDPAETLTRDDVAPILHSLLQDTGGVHLRTLAGALPQRPRGAHWKTGDARALLARLEVRVRAGVRVPGAGGREGVHRDDLPPLPCPTSETAPEAVVVPGQNNNNNPGNSYPFTIVDDPDDPAHAIVRSHTH